MRLVWTAIALIPTSTATFAFTQTKFANEGDARLHCPADAIVWQIFPGNIFVRKGDTRYGTTQRGSYMCERDAVAAGDRLGH